MKKSSEGSDAAELLFRGSDAAELLFRSSDALCACSEGSEVTPELLLETGVVSNAKAGIKVLGNGTLNVKLTVKAHKFSASAKEAIENAGGSIEVI